MVLGYRYMHGIGTARNCEEGVWYYSKISKRGTPIYILFNYYMFYSIIFFFWTYFYGTSIYITIYIFL